MQIYKAHKQPTVRRCCPRQNKCVFSNRRNFRKVCSESRRRRGMVCCSTDATVNERSPRLLRILETSHVATLDDRSRCRPAVEVSWQLSAKYHGDWQAIQRFVHQNCQLEFNALSHWPVFLTFILIRTYLLRHRTLVWRALGARPLNSRPTQYHPHIADCLWGGLRSEIHPRIRPVLRASPTQPACCRGITERVNKPVWLLSSQWLSKPVTCMSTCSAKPISSVALHSFLYETVSKAFSKSMK